METILFDLDGVILKEPSLRAATGEEVAELATRRACEEIGLSDPVTEFVESTRYNSYENLVEAVDVHGVDVDPEKVWPMRERHLSEIEREYLRDGKRKAYDDVGAIDHLTESVGSMAIVSNARHDTVDFIVEHLDLDHAIDAVRGQYPDPEDWYRKKPEPDYIHEVLERLGAETGVYVGDSESDIVAADRAGLDSAFVRRAHNREVELDHDPTYEIETLYDLLDLV
jgi:HAD superfamily hydrolase (TIGR01549 family)